jgi:hypothetical protein
LLDIYRRFRGAYWLTVMMETKFLRNVGHTMRCNISEGSHIHTRRHENLKSHLWTSNIPSYLCENLTFLCAYFSWNA